MPSTITTLQAARDLISDEDNWVRYNFFSEGGYCAQGALAKVTGLPVNSDFWAEAPSNPSYLAAAYALANAVGISPEQEKIIPDIGGWNNSNDHETVLDGFDKAIEVQRHHPIQVEEPGLKRLEFA